MPALGGVLLLWLLQGGSCPSQGNQGCLLFPLLTHTYILAQDRPPGFDLVSVDTFSADIIVAAAFLALPHVLRVTPSRLCVLSQLSTQVTQPLVQAALSEIQYVTLRKTRSSLHSK